MKYVIVSIFDSAAGVYSQPQYAPATPAALRGFKDAVNTPDSGVGKHPDDYTLYELGSFDDNNGKFQIHEEPIRVARAKDLVGG